MANFPLTDTLNENEIKVSERVKSEISRLKTQASLVPIAVSH